VNATVTTKSGAIYEFKGDQVRRVNASHKKRADGEWVKLIQVIPRRPEVGQMMILVIESLADHGPDDEGTTTPSDVTTRSTTTIVDIEWNEGTP